jgi:negative regulator of replication initiation
MTTPDEMFEIAVDIDVYKIIEAKRTAFTQDRNDILRQILGLCPALEVSIDRNPAENDPTPDRRRKRATGAYKFSLLGTYYSEPNLKSAYMKILRLFSDRSAAFLEDYAKLETASRRFISRDRDNLYKKSGHLSHSAEIFIDDWWIDVNLSQEQVESRLLKACDTAKLNFDSDLKLNFPMS